MTDFPCCEPSPSLEHSLVIYFVAGEYVMADGGGWLPGVYDTEECARKAYSFGYASMYNFWTAHCKTFGTPAPAATLADVMAWMRL